jgi:hypothetical protein
MKVWTVNPLPHSLASTDFLAVPHSHLVHVAIKYHGVVITEGPHPASGTMAIQRSKR